MHKEHLKQVFEVLKWFCTVVTENKSAFMMVEIHFLGHIRSKDGVRMECYWIGQIFELFMMDGVFIIWEVILSSICKDCFTLACIDLQRTQVSKDQLGKKGHFINQRRSFLLNMLYLRKPFLVQFDACSRSTAAMLMQEGHTRAYESKNLLKAENSLHVQKKDLLAVVHALSTCNVHALSTWRHHLQGAKFFV